MQVRQSLFGGLNLGNIFADGNGVVRCDGCWTPMGLPMGERVSAAKRVHITTNGDLRGLARE